MHTRHGDSINLLRKATLVPTRHKNIATLLMRVCVLCNQTQCPLKLSDLPNVLRETGNQMEWKRGNKPIKEPTHTIRYKKEKREREGKLLNSDVPTRLRKLNRTDY